MDVRDRTASLHHHPEQNFGKTLNERHNVSIYFLDASILVSRMLMLNKKKGEAYFKMYDA